MLRGTALLVMKLNNVTPKREPLWDILFTVSELIHLPLFAVQSVWEHQIVRMRSS